MRKGIKELFAAANAVIQTISVHDALTYYGDSDTLFVDVRNDSERHEKGSIPSAIAAPRGYLEFYLDPESTLYIPALASGKRLVIFCASGGRSTLATKTLVDMGVQDVVNMAGGMAAWLEAGGPVVFDSKPAKAG